MKAPAKKKRSRDPRTVRNRVIRLVDKIERDARVLLVATDVGAADNAILIAQKCLPRHLTQLRAELLALWQETP